MSKEDDAMPIVLEKARMNFWNLVGFAATITVTAFGWGVTFTTMQNGIAQAKEEVVRTNARVEKVETAILPIPILQLNAAQFLQFQGMSKQADDETNKRIDRVVDTFNSKLDTMITGLTALTIKVEVQNAQIQKDRANDRSTRSRP